MAGRLLVVTLLLVGCGLIEGYISPDPSFPFASRVAVGLGSWFIAICAATGLLYRRRGASLRQMRRRARIRS